MKPKTQKLALISDFDGTATKVDFFWYVVEKLLTNDDIKPWEDYLAKKISHFEALRRIFSKIRLPEKDFKDFILSMPIEDGFTDTIHYCNTNDIPVFIASAGADYYIKLILNDLGIDEKITLFANKSNYDPEKGLILTPQNPKSPYYSEKYGISKKKILQNVKDQNYFCVFAGDGGPDIEPASLAHTVFARSRLEELCKETALKYNGFTNYYNILEYLKNVRF